MSLTQVIFGWLFQEHIREEFNMTSGKRFMLKQDFRNRFITQSIEIVKNLIFWVHAITTLEIGTLLLFLLTLFYLISIELVAEQKTKYVFTEHLIVLLFIFLITQSCKIYGLFDLFFILRPFIIFILSLYIILAVLSFSYFCYFSLINTSKTLSLIFRLCLNKLTFISFFLFLEGAFFLIIIIQENILNENFFHELILQTFCFRYFILDFLNN